MGGVKIYIILSEHTEMTAEDIRNIHVLPSPHVLRWSIADNKGGYSFAFQTPIQISKWSLTRGRGEYRGGEYRGGNTWTCPDTDKIAFAQKMFCPLSALQSIGKQRARCIDGRANKFTAAERHSKGGNRTL